MAKTDAAFVAAMSLVIAGVALVTVAGALVVAGLLLGLLTVLYKRGEA